MSSQRSNGSRVGYKASMMRSRVGYKGSMVRGRVGKERSSMVDGSMVRSRVGQERSSMVDGSNRVMGINMLQQGFVRADGT